MKLSKRLEAVATLVDIDARVIDVGCDHAYLDIYLTLNNNNVCIATDINENALSIARSNINKYKLTGKIETLLSDGLKDIEIKKTDNIVICGMGTYTILEILQTNKLSDTLIISSNNNIKILREKVVNLGYHIDTEIFLFDKGKPYIIIKFKKGMCKYSKIDYEFGPILKNNIEYLIFLENKYKNIFNNISKNKFITRLKYQLLIAKIIILKKRLKS